MRQRKVRSMQTRLFPVALLALLALTATAVQAQPIYNGELDSNLDGWLAFYEASRPGSQGTVHWTSDSGGAAYMEIHGSPGMIGIFGYLGDTIFPGNALWFKVTHTDLTVGGGFHMDIGNDPFGQHIEDHDTAGTYTYQITADRMYLPGTTIRVTFKCWPGDDTAYVWYIRTDAPGIQDAERVSTPVGQPMRSIPNPFRRATSITFAVPREAEAVVRVYDGSGRLVKELARGRLPAGEQVQVWDGTDSDARPVPPGTYFCKVDVGSETLVSRAIRLE